MIESQIDGAFRGWSGKTLFRLVNGQLWKQASYDYLYQYTYRPLVKILVENGVYVMQVEGVNTHCQSVRLLR